MRSKFLLPLLCLASVIGLTACSPVEHPVNLAPPSFRHMQPITLNMSTITLRNEYQPDFSKKHVEQFFVNPPAKGVEIWMNERLRASGNPGAPRMEVVILDASVVENALPVTEGLKGNFTKEPNERFEARLEVQLRVYDGKSSLSQSEVKSTVAIARELQEGATIRDHDELYAEMTRSMLAELDKSLTNGINQYLARYISY